MQHNANHARREGPAVAPNLLEMIPFLACQLSFFFFPFLLLVPCLLEDDTA